MRYVKGTAALIGCFGLLVSCNQSAPQSKPDTAIDKIPAICGDTYRCSEMITVVNHLKGLGRDKCLATLHRYLVTEEADHAKVLILCRLLFINPNGWDWPAIGEPVPTIKSDDRSTFPLFPVALFNRVPFLLVKGYDLEGRRESAFPCLKLCNRLSLIENDYPLTGYEKAARALIDAKSFREVYQLHDLPLMSEMIISQANVKSQWAGKSKGTQIISAAGGTP